MSSSAVSVWRAQPMRCEGGMWGVICWTGIHHLHTSTCGRAFDPSCRLTAFGPRRRLRWLHHGNTQTLLHSSSRMRCRHHLTASPLRSHPSSPLTPQHQPFSHSSTRNFGLSISTSSDILLLATCRHALYRCSPQQQQRRCLPADTACVAHAMRPRLCSVCGRELLSHLPQLSCSSVGADRRSRRAVLHTTRQRELRGSRGHRRWDRQGGVGREGERAAGAPLGGLWTGEDKDGGSGWQR